MNTLTKSLSGLAAGVALSLAAVSNTPATAATLTGNFEVDVAPTPSTLTSNTYFGTYSFDSTNFNGTGDISPTNGGLKLNFNFVNLADASIPQTYTEADDLFYSDFPQLSLSNGILTGLDYVVGNLGGSFSIDGSTFLYSVNNSGASGNGTVKYSVPKVASVPESSAVLGLAMLGLGGVAACYRQSKQQQNRYQTLP